MHQSISEKTKKNYRSKQLLSVETFKSHAAEEVLKAAVEELGWKNVTAASSGACKSNCDIYWRGLDRDEPPIPESSYIARIPGMSTIAHKAELSRHINRLRHFFPEDFSFYPRTWLLPEDQEEFEAYAQSSKGKKKTFITKPDEGAQGEGIFLVQHPRQLTCLRHPSVVQEYIANPLLLRGLKFDFRLYVLIASLVPPAVYLSDSGMARFCTIPYSTPSIANMHETFMHLTNYSLNKRSKGYVHSECSDEGSKRTLDSVFKELESHGHNVREIWEKVEELVCKTFFALLPQLMVDGRSYMSQHSLTKPVNAFQVLGIDVLIDHKLRPHLLEVNAYPSLRLDFEQMVKPGVVEYVPSTVDMEIKLPVVRDSLKIIGARLKGQLQGVEDTCFSELLPAQLDTYSNLRVFERCGNLYSHFLGVRRGLRMGSSSFRSFTRQCKLCTKNFTSADADILFIEVCRGHGNTYERNALSFNAFCEALLLIARKTGEASQSGAVCASEKTGAARSCGKTGRVGEPGESDEAGDSLITLKLLLNHCEKLINDL